MYNSKLRINKKKSELLPKLAKSTDKNSSYFNYFQLTYLLETVVLYYTTFDLYFLSLFLSFLQTR